jgi:hypothetical protein
MASAERYYPILLWADEYFFSVIVAERNFRDLVKRTGQVAEDGWPRGFSVQRKVSITMLLVKDILVPLDTLPHPQQGACSF